MCRSGDLPISKYPGVWDLTIPLRVNRGQGNDRNRRLDSFDRGCEYPAIAKDIAHPRSPNKVSGIVLGEILVLGTSVVGAAESSTSTKKEVGSRCHILTASDTRETVLHDLALTFEPCSGRTRCNPECRSTVFYPTLARITYSFLYSNVGDYLAIGSRREKGLMLE